MAEENGALRKSHTISHGLPSHLTPGNPGNSGGKPGRSGRKPLPFKVLCRDILESEDTIEAMKLVARTPNYHGFTALLKLLSSYSEGLPVQTVEIEGRLLLDDITGMRGTDKLLPGEELADYEVLPAGDDTNPDESEE